MVIIRDEKKIARLRQVGMWANFVGLGVLIAGLILPLIIQNDQILIFQVLAIPVGWLLSQVGIYYTHRFVRDPRPDEVLDESLRKVARNGRLYHYVLPAPHVLLTPAGIIILVAKYQVGNVSYANGRWQQRGVSAVRRLFSQEGLGNPTAEAQRDIQKLVKFLKKHAPQVEEVSIGAMIVFTTKNGGELDVKDAPLPTMHAAKLKGVFKQTTQGAPLPAADYQALQAAFDRAAGKLVAVPA